MLTVLENLSAYIIIFLITGSILFFYLKRLSRKNISTHLKLEKAHEYGFHEPVSLHPVIDVDSCIGSGACVAACPEKDILGIINGRAHLINASRCVGHGACFNACPMKAITLCIGTEKRGVELPHITPDFETNIPGIFIAGELGGMGLIKNAVEQGRQAVENICKKNIKSVSAELDLIIIGAGPAGISASLTAAKNKLKFITLEQDSLGGSVFNFPRAKIVMTSPMVLPLYGKLKFTETSKSKLLDIWNDVLSNNGIVINEQEKAESIEKKDNYFIVKSSKNTYTTVSVLIAIGRRGSPRKLGIKGEEKEKVAYRLLEPDYIQNQKILIVGGGDSAVESALLLVENGNEITLSYRGISFSRLKPKNLEKINTAISEKKIMMLFNSNVIEIRDEDIILTVDNEQKILRNDLVYIFAGGELPVNFLENIGVKITKQFGEALLKHQK